MNIQFDHLVHLTKNPEKAQQTFTSLGFRTIKGGHHPNWGTYNSLCFFQNLRYIEWIGFTDFLTAKNCHNPLINQIVFDYKNGEGFSQIAFRTNDIHSLKHSLEKKGFQTIGPINGSRQKEDGSFLSWNMLFLKEDNVDLRYPFFIQWEEKDDNRKKEMKELMRHSIGTPSLSSIGYFVQRPEEMATNFAMILNVEVSSIKEKINQLGTYFDLSINQFSLRFYKHQNFSNKPVICEISGFHKENTININGARYLFTK